MLIITIENEDSIMYHMSNSFRHTIFKNNYSNTKMNIGKKKKILEILDPITKHQKTGVNILANIFRYREYKLYNLSLIILDVEYFQNFFISRSWSLFKGSLVS